MSLKDIDIGIKKIKSMLISDLERQLKLLGIGYDKIYTHEEINDVFDINRKYKRKQVLDVLINECEESEIGLLLSDAKIREKNIRKFIRECAFDLLNKICAIRLLEERNMIAPTIKKFKEYGNKSEVQKNLGQVSYSLLDRDPYDGLRYAIESTLRELSTQIKVLFEVNSEHSLLFPDPKTLKEIINVLLDEIPEEDWRRDDFIGWTYQYFVEDEKEEIEQADTPEEIAAKTQVYTYDWIVKYIVDNTLGAYWNEIKSGERPKQSVETIKLIDPSCGSGSFLVYAFDKFYEIYKEEGKVSEEDIPNFIISKNLYGLDIDERAVQLSALNLYIKAKERNRNIQIDKFNIICTDSRIKQEVNIDKYLLSLSIDPKLREVIKNIVHQAFNYMKENNILGSLMKIEEVINPIIDEYIGGRRRLSIREVQAKKERFKANAEQMSLFSPEIEQLSLDTIDEIRYFESREEFVDYLRQKILDCVDYVVTKINKDNDINSRMFAKDLNRGSNFIGAMMQKYEIVVGNPPYLNQKGMGDNIRNKLRIHYNNTKTDLYACFIELMLGNLSQFGICGFLTPDTYISLSTYEYLRKKIVENYYIKKFIHLGKKTFKSVNVSISIGIIYNNTSETDSLFLDLKNFDDQEGKIKDDTLKWYIKNAKDFSKIPSYRFIYWSSSDLSDKIVKYDKLEPKYAIVKQGLATSNNNKFVYMRWEVNNYLNKNFYPYAKGGGFNKFFGRNDFIVDWSQDAIKIYKSPKGRYRGYEYYFKQGLTFSLITSENKFSCRFLPEGWVFDIGGPSIFCLNIDSKYLLAIMNSKLINKFLELINPTVNFQIGDIKNTPIIVSSNYTYEMLKNITNCIMYLKIINYKTDILSEMFVTDFFSNVIAKEKLDNKSLLKLYQDNIISNFDILLSLEELQHILDEVVFFIYDVSDNDRLEILTQYGNNCIEYPIVDGYFSSPQLTKINVEEKYIEHIICKGETISYIKECINQGIMYINNLYEGNPNLLSLKNLEPKYVKLSDEEFTNLVDKIRNLSLIKGIDIIKIAEEVKIHPRSIMSIMNEKDIYLQEDFKEKVKRYLQTLARKAFDEDKDGIVLLPEMLDKIHDELSKTFKDRASSIETEINNIIGKDIEKWLMDEFAIDYINNTGYDKKTDTYKEIKNPWEPLIWKGQSPKKNFTVFVWRYKITPDTELKIRSQYLENEIESYKMRIKDIDSKLVIADEKEKKVLEKERDEILSIVDDLNDYHKWIKKNGIKLRGMWFNLE
jgi:hypothetical protein